VEVTTETPLAARLNRDELGRADLAARLVTSEERLAEVPGELSVPQGRLLASAPALSASPSASALGPVHGDLSARHLLLNARGALGGP
jgi:hypothetical protein